MVLQGGCINLVTQRVSNEIRTFEPLKVLENFSYKCELTANASVGVCYRYRYATCKALTGI